MLIASLRDASGADASTHVACVGREIVNPQALQIRLRLVRGGDIHHIWSDVSFGLTSVCLAIVELNSDSSDLCTKTIGCSIIGIDEMSVNT